MAEDIGIELHDKIKQAFDARCARDSTLTHIKRKIEGGTATMEDTSIYARRLGELLRKSIESTTKPDDLPGEKMYYNIAQSILEPLLRGNYDDVNAICAEVQSALDAKKGIGLKPQKADFPAERVRAAIGGAAVKETAEHAIQVLGRTAENITGSFQTDYIKKNAEFRSKAGLNCYIERKDGHNCCDWCSKLAGRYRYPDEVPKDVYRRHDNCTCDVSYVSEKGRQNVHSKRWANEQAKAQRIAYAASVPKPMKLTRAEAIAKESEILAQRRLTYDAKRGIINEKSNKPIIAITDSAIQNVQYVGVYGYTEEQSKAIQRQHKELLKIARDKNNNFEVALVLNNNLEAGNPLFGRDNDVEFGLLNGINLTVLHNHPRGSGFSANDLKFFCQCDQVKTLTIVKNNGQVEYITKSERFNPEILSLEYARMHKKMIKKGTSDEYDKLINRLLTTSKSGVIWNE